MITQNIHVRMDAYGIPPVIHAVEGDTWRYLDIYTDDAAINTSNTAVVAIHRPDDSYYIIEAMPQSLSYHLEMDQALTRPGKVECQLKVSSGDLVISTYTFYIIVEPSTTGLPTEQLGYDIYDLIDAAQQIQNVGLTEEVKQALLDCFEHVAWTDEHGQDYVDALEAALYPPAELVSISAVYTQSGTVYDTASLDDLKPDLVVTAHYDDGTSEAVTNYTLSGALSVGTSTVTVSYGGKTTTFSVTVTHYVQQYSVTYNLTNVISSNTSQTVGDGESYTTVLSAQTSGYMPDNVVVTMGGVTLDNVYNASNYTITITEVTGAITITASETLIPPHNYLDDAIKTFDQSILNTNEQYNFYELNANDNQKSYIVPLEAGSYRLAVKRTSGYDSNLYIGTTLMKNFTTGLRQYILISDMDMTDATSSRITNTTFTQATSIVYTNAGKQSDNLYLYYIDFAFSKGGYIGLPLATNNGAVWTLTEVTA